jgi:phosphoribosylformylglycinamidine synthase
MTPYDVMLSESQERMLIAVRKRHRDDVAKLFERWEVPWAIIGEVTVDGYARIYDGEALVADLPIEAVVEAPEYTQEPVRPPELDEMQALDLSALPDLPAGRHGVTDANAALLRLLASPNVASKRWVYRQYDQSVLTNTVIEAGADAAVLRVKGTDRGIAVTTDGNGRYCHVSPGAGGAIAVAEAARNVVCVGAQPLAVTDCLNFGNPERPDVYYRMQEVIRGMAAACQALGTPVVSGNVSLYNETGGQAVYPTPVIGMLGLLEDVSKHCRPGLGGEGEELFLLGAALEQPAAALAASEYLKLAHGLIGGRLEFDLDLEARVQRAALAAIRQGVATACHDCSDGGLAVALAEMCLAGGLGLDATQAPQGARLDAALFGEAQSRILVAVPTGRREELLTIARGLNVPFAYVGRAGGDRLRLWSLDLPLAELREAYEGGLERAMQG